MFMMTIVPYLISDRLIRTAAANVKRSQAEQAPEKVGRFVGRGFSHDISALDSPGVLTPEARESHFSAACEGRPTPGRHS